MKQHFEILKRLIAEAEEETNVDAEASDEETVEEPKPGSFEADPMAFILKKYHGLNELMTELMTKDFQEYVDGIFIMAPKPTTFKIQLHNGQFFFLVYLGKAYEATIEGKKYYLMGIGEKERCMTAIARLLRFGTPLKTQGPEGAEQATREEENTGMEGDWAAQGGATGGMAPEAGVEETPPEESGTEELAETRRILEAILMREAKEDPKLFLKHTMLALQDIGETPSKIESKNGGPHTRASLGDETESVKKLTNALIDTGLDKTDFKIDVVEKGKSSQGSRSGKFTTYIITAKKDITLDNGQVIKKNSQAHVVSNVETGKSTIAAKSVTPGAFGMNGKTFESAQQIVDQVQPGLNSMPNKELGNALSLLMSDINKLSGPTISSISKVKDYTKNITLDKKTQAALTNVLPGDLAIVGKDFGEVLGAILLAKEIKLQKGVTFPKGNQPLVDFFVDGYGISSKYKSGAAATLTNPIAKIDPEQLTTKEQKQLYDQLSEAFKLGVSDSYLKLAKKFAPEEVGTLAYSIGVPEKNLTTQAINDYITQLMPDKAPKDNDPKLDKKIKEEFGAFFSKADSQPSFPIKWGELQPSKYYGIVMGPLSAAVARKLNANAEMVKALKEIISKVEIKQLYFDFNLKSNSLVFKLKSFADESAKFSFTPANISVYNPDNGKMGFKMK